MSRRSARKYKTIYTKNGSKKTAKFLKNMLAEKGKSKAEVDNFTMLIVMALIMFAWFVIGLISEYLETIC